MSLTELLSNIDDAPRPKKEPSVLIKQIDAEHEQRVFYQPSRRSLLFIIKKRNQDQWMQWLSWEIAIGPLMKLFGVGPEDIAASMLNATVGEPESLPKGWRRFSGLKEPKE